MSHRRPPRRTITWLDPYSPGATEVYNLSDLSGVHRPVQVTTMGWVLKEDETGVTLASEDCGGGDYRGLTFILRVLMVADRPRARRGQRALPPSTLPPETPA